MKILARPVALQVKRQHKKKRLKQLPKSVQRQGPTATSLYRYSFLASNENLQFLREQVYNDTVEGKNIGAPHNSEKHTKKLEK